MASYATLRRSINRHQTLSLSVKRLLREIVNTLDSVSTAITTGYASLSTYNVWTSAQGSPIITLTDGATITVDLSLGNVFEVTLDGNRTIDFTNATAGQHFTMVITQDATTGGRTLTWDAANDWAGGTAPTLSTGTGAVDILSFMVDSSGNIHGNLGIANSQ